MDPLVHSFKTDISNIELPSQFNYPFYYQPHELAVLAAQQLQAYLEQQYQWFVANGTQEAGKMFGVLVVQDEKRNLGFLAGFSGKLGGETTQEHFVPPVYQLERVDQFFKQETDKLDAVTKQIAALENDPVNIQLIADYNAKAIAQTESLEREQERIKAIKRERRRLLKREKAVMETEAFKSFEARQRQLSLNNNFFLKEYEVYLEDKIATLKNQFESLQLELENLRSKRRKGSLWLQDWLFDEYNFLNARKETQNVKELFKNRIPDVPPAGTGDCAAPKMLQYAYAQNLKPITMAEFWYGPSPASKVRSHGNFYPACRSKCEPVLEFMLQGLDVEDNPLLENPAVDKELDIIFEDEHMLAVHKPAEFLSVAGKSITDSVQTRMKAKYPNATGPMIVHRLDMSTSGILLVAKTMEAYHHLQQQFLKRTVEKRYVAVLNGHLEKESGFIDLPLRVDLDNRPCQLVDFEFGKSARTRFEVIERNDHKTKVHFFPITGRTHQLRVHAAHVDGLNAPIVGDDLYGTTDSRLHLHAEQIIFEHPLSRKRITLNVPAPFDFTA
ncbi:pseudouridine synthase [Nonlabens sp. YIK11]|uniref:RluA family pseudouridine synthase n=1 Tax=Nonlabens sp. YIK11 TaxID=1453349 RepID=UPI0006DC2E16|nr:RluA family pseudouridine synthase [Nonlabens sp. YIK11]KQC33898.1 pseudouridine synthase [Nonlabens sp. YIK11]